MEQKAKPSSPSAASPDSSRIEVPESVRAALLARHAYLEQMCSGNDLTAWYEPRSGWSYANDARRDEIRWINALLEGRVEPEAPLHEDVPLLSLSNMRKSYTISWETRVFGKMRGEE